MPCRKKTLYVIAIAAIVGSIALSRPVRAADATPAAAVSFSDGHFAPAKLTVPANQPFKVRVTNSGKTAIEFESFDLHRERVVRPGQTITVYMGPAAPGHYSFCDDFDHRVAAGAIEAR